MILTIDTLSLTRLSNKNHVQFHKNVKELILRHSLEALGLDEKLFNQYQSCIDAEDHVCSRNRISPLSSQLLSVDRTRNDVFVYIMRALKNMHFTGQDAELKVYEQLLKKDFFKRYPLVLVRRELLHKTALYRSLVNELRTDFAEAVAISGLDSSVDELENDNNIYEALFLQRNKETSDIPKCAMRLARQATESEYRCVCLAISHIANLASEDVDKQRMQNENRTLLTNINMLIKKMKTELKSKATWATKRDEDEVAI